VINITPHMRILVCVDPVDFRKGLDGLAAVCRQQLHADPFSGTAFLFTNRKRTALRVLMFDSQGLWLCHKRLSRSKFVWWPAAGDSASCELAVHELQLLLWNGDPSKVEVSPAWRELPKPPRPQSVEEVLESPSNGASSREPRVLTSRTPGQGQTWDYDAAARRRWRHSRGARRASRK
jgi:hypothetical protein